MIPPDPISDRHTALRTLLELEERRARRAATIRALLFFGLACSLLSVQLSLLIILLNH